MVQGFCTSEIWQRIGEWNGFPGSGISRKYDGGPISVSSRNPVSYFPRPQRALESAMADSNGFCGLRPSLNAEDAEVRRYEICHLCIEWKSWWSGKPEALSYSSRWKSRNGRVLAYYWWIRRRLSLSHRQICCCGVFKWNRDKIIVVNWHGSVMHPKSAS